MANRDHHLRPRAPRPACPGGAAGDAPSARRWVVAVATLPLLALSASACSGQGSAPAAAGRSGAPPTSPSTGAPSPQPSSSTAAAPSQQPAAVESNPPGDIPDNIAYVAYHNATGRYAFVHPEGWASIVRGSIVTFTDKLNGVTATAVTAGGAPTVATAKQDIAGLQATQPAFELRSVKPVTLPGGSGVLIVFRRNSAPDPVTGRVFRDEVERYEIYRSGHEVLLDLYGAVGSDNVDPYTKISQSLRLS